MKKVRTDQYFLRVICLAQEHNVHGDPSKDRTPTSESEALTTRPPLTPMKVVIPIFAIYKLVSIRFNHSSIIMKQIWRCMYKYEFAHPSMALKLCKPYPFSVGYIEFLMTMPIMK